MRTSMTNDCLPLYSFYEETGEPTEYFWQIDRKIQFGEFSTNNSNFAKGKTTVTILKSSVNIYFDHCKLILGIKQQEEEQNSKVEFPPCNVEYKADTEKTRFWCTTVSRQRLSMNHQRNLIVCFYFSNLEASSVTGPVTQFNSSIKMTRLTLAFVQRKKTLIYLSLDNTKTATTQRDLV